MKRRLIALLVLAALVSGCAAGRSFRKGQEAARAGDWDTAVQHFTDGGPGEPGQRRIQDRARAGDAERRARSHHQGARARAEGSARRGADRVQEGASRWTARTASPRRARPSSSASSATASRSRARSRRSRRCGSRRARRAFRVLNPADRTPLKINFNNSSLRDILNFIGTTTGINIQLRRRLRRQGLHRQPRRRERSRMRCSRSCRRTASSTRCSTRRRSSSRRTTRPEHLKYDDLVVQVFYLSHADTQELSQVLNTMMRIQAQVAPAMLSRTRRRTRSPCARRRRSWR